MGVFGFGCEWWSSYGVGAGVEWGCALFPQISGKFMQDGRPVTEAKAQDYTSTKVSPGLQQRVSLSAKVNPEPFLKRMGGYRSN